MVIFKPLHCQKITKGKIYKYQKLDLFKMKLWTIIPAISLLTLIYLGLGNMGFWYYTDRDVLFGNSLIIFGVGLVYLTKKVLKKEWNL